MKGTKCIVLTFVVAFLLSSLIMTANSANPESTDWIPDRQITSITVGQANRPSIATAGDGSLWVAFQLYNTATSCYDIRVAKSTDYGLNWLSIYTYSIGYNLRVPSIAVDPYTNYVYVAFEREFTATDHDIALLRYTGTAWSQIWVANDNNDDFSPSITCENDMGDHPSGGNYVFLTWERRIESQDYVGLMFARSTDGGATWGTAIAVANHGYAIRTEQPSMAFASGPAGHCIYIAFRYRGTDGISNKICVVRSTDEGGSFLVFQDVTPYITNVLREPSIAAVHGGSVVVVAWTYAYSSTDDDISYSYSTDSGVTWSMSYGLATSGSKEMNPHLTVDGMGNTANIQGYIHATYMVLETDGSRTNGMYYSKVYYTTPTSWSPQVQVVDDNAFVAYPPTADRVITTVHNTVPVIVWTDYRNPPYDIYATTLGGKYTFNTSPTGLQVSVDGTPYTAPQSFYWPYLSVHTLSVTSPQGQYVFQSWSDGGAQTHSVTANNLGETTITANFLQNKAYLVVRGSSNQIYYRSYTSGTDVWGSWVQLPGASNDPPAAAVMGSELHIVVRGVSGGQIWHGYVNLNTNAFSGWTLLSGATPSPPTLTANSTHLCLVVRGNNDRIYFRWYTLASHVWSGWWYFPGGSTPDTPAAELMEDNKLQFVVRGSNGNQLWFGTLNTASDAWSGWSLLSGATPSAPVLASVPNYLCLVVRGENNLIYYRWYDVASNSWYTGWFALSDGATSASPTATIVPVETSYMEIAVRGTGSNQIWHGKLEIYSNVWSGWTMVDGSTPSKPVLTS